MNDLCFGRITKLPNLHNLKNQWHLVLVSFIVLAIFLFIYRSALYNLITADDFIYLTWSHKAISHPELILEKYLVPTNNLVFYRPLIFTILAMEYKFWGLNTLCFHVTNIILELTTGLTVAALITNLSTVINKSSTSLNTRTKIWTTMSASLFILHPLHNESVNSISDQVDLFVTLFFLSSFWCYIQWRKKSKVQFFVVSLGMAILAFLTKEMCVALPPTLFLYEILCLDLRLPSSANDSAISKFPSRLFTAFSATLPYWLLLGLYFLIRRIILGDIIAGYSDEMCHHNLRIWIHSLKEVIDPINPLVFNSENYLVKLWHILLVTCVALSLIATTKAGKSEKRLVFFLLGWTVLALAPTFKIFPVMMNYLSGSRLAYLASAPLCAFLTYGLATFSIHNRFRNGIRLVATLLLITSASILYKYNLAWNEAGAWTNNVFNKISQCYPSKDEDLPIYVTGLPLFHDNGVFCIGLLEAITKTPFMNKDFYRCVRLDANELSPSPGILKEAASKHKNIQLVYWDKTTNDLIPVPHPFHHVSNIKSRIKISTTPQGSLILATPTLKGLPCWNIDFIKVELKAYVSTNIAPVQQAVLVFSNDLVKQPNTVNCWAPIKKEGNTTEIIFPVRNLPSWTMGGNCSSAHIILPPTNQSQQAKLSTLDAGQLMPTFKISTLSQDPPGQIRLDLQDHKTQCVEYDSSRLKNSEHLFLEIIAFPKTFEYLDSHPENNNLAIQIKTTNNKGQLIIRRTDLPANTGVYRARIRSFDATNNQIGFSSDTFLIFVDS